jgi:hypothetical protein
MTFLVELKASHYAASSDDKGCENNHMQIA